jgi:hypothetical protein
MPRTKHCARFNDFELVDVSGKRKKLIVRLDGNCCFVNIVLRYEKSRAVERRENNMSITRHNINIRS